MDEKAVLTTGNWASDSTARLWDVATGRQIRAFKNHTAPIGKALFSPDGKRILTSSMDRTARVWDVASGEEIASFRGHEDVVNSATFSPDGMLILTTSWDKTARVWSMATKKEVSQFHMQTNRITAMFSSDAKLVLTADGESAKLWDPLSGKQIHQFDKCRAARLSPNGKQVLISDDEATTLYDIATRKQIIQTKEKRLPTEEFSPDGKYLVTVSENAARIWNSQTGLEIACYKKHTAKVLAAVFSPDGKYFLTTSADDTIRMWEMASGNEIVRLKTEPGVSLCYAKVSPDGCRIAMYGLNGLSNGMDIGIWERSGKKIAYLGTDLTTVAFARDSRTLLTAGGDWGKAKLWDAITGKVLMDFGGHSDELRSAQPSQDGKRLLLCMASPGNPNFDYGIVWDFDSGRMNRVKWESYVRSARFSPDASTVLTDVHLDRHRSVFSLNGKRLLSWSAEGTVLNDLNAKKTFSLNRKPHRIRDVFMRRCPCAHRESQ